MASKWVSGAVNLGEGDANNIVVSSRRGKKGRSSKWDFIGEGKADRQPFQRATAGAYQLHTARSLKMNINPSLVIPQ